MTGVWIVERFCYDRGCWEPWVRGKVFYETEDKAQKFADTSVKRLARAVRWVPAGRYKKTDYLPNERRAMKTCRICHERRPLLDFPVNHTRYDGRHYYCRECSNKISKRWQAKVGAKP